MSLSARTRPAAFLGSSSATANLTAPTGRTNSTADPTGPRGTLSDIGEVGFSRKTHWCVMF